MRTAILALSAVLAGPVAAQDLPDHAVDVLRHTVLHAMFEGLLQEFNLPILAASEELAADTFTSLILPVFYGADTPRIAIAGASQWAREQVKIVHGQPTFEGPPDMRRAYRAVCLVYGSNPAEFGTLADWGELDEAERAGCSQTTLNEGRGMIYLLAANTLKEGHLSLNVEVVYGEGPMTDPMIAAGVMEEAGEIARFFDWRTPITLRFDYCDDSAWWSRAERTVTLCDAHVRRLAATPPPAASLPAIWRRG